MTEALNTYGYTSIKVTFRSIFGEAPTVLCLYKEDLDHQIKKLADLVQDHIIEIADKKSFCHYRSELGHDKNEYKIYFSYNEKAECMLFQIEYVPKYQPTEVHFNSNMAKSIMSVQCYFDSNMSYGHNTQWFEEYTSKFGLIAKMVYK